MCKTYCLNYSAGRIDYELTMGRIW